MRNVFLITIIFNTSAFLCGSPISTTSGGTGLTSMTAYALLTGGTTATGSLQQISGVGTSGQVLTNGTTSALPTWQNNNYGLTLLKTLTASSSATLTLTSTEINSTYNVYLIELDNLQPVSAGVVLQAYFSNNNGTSYFTTGYLGGINTLAYNSAIVTNTNSTTYIPLSGTTSLYVSGYLYLYPNIASFSGSGAIAFMNGQVITDYPGVFGMIVGYQNTAGLVVNNIKFQFSSGNIFQGIIKLYGFKSS